MEKKNRNIEVKCKCGKIWPKMRKSKKNGKNLSQIAKKKKKMDKKLAKELGNTYCKKWRKIEERMGGKSAKTDKK